MGSKCSDLSMDQALIWHRHSWNSFKIMPVNYLKIIYYNPRYNSRLNKKRAAH